tara:strand:- start:6893 stop:7708 length:816 start_codon:yes stop_codon:yes gene_type:complete
METGKSNSFKSKTFNAKLAQQYHISIQISESSLKYCVIEKSNYHIEFFKIFPSLKNIINTINNEDILKLNFSSSNIIFENLSCTLVPQEFYSKENNKKFLDFNTEKNGIIKSDKIKNIDAFLIYSFDKKINNIIETILPKAKQQSQQSILIDLFSNMNNDKQHAYINIENNKLIITIFKENKLIFNNTFEYISLEDILYYTLFSFEQLKIDREKVEVNLFGDINDKDETFKLLYEYIRNIHIAKDEKKFIFPVESSIKSENTHYTLLHSII